LQLNIDKTERSVAHFLTPYFDVRITFVPPLENEAGLFTVSQKAILMDKKNQILMMKKAGKTHWDIPGGKLEEGEDMIKGLYREVREETGFIVTSEHLIHTGSRTFDEPEKNDRIMVFYFCQFDQSFEDIQLSDEHEDWRMMTRADTHNAEKYEINPVVLAALQKAFTFNKTL